METIGGLRDIRRLDPVRDHQRIVFLATCCEFPFDVPKALEFALFRTFAVPRIGALLDRTGEFAHRAQKRYDDTDLVISELIEHGYDSEHGRRALHRMNQLHGRFAIANDDFLYVLSTFVFEPARWVERFGRRPFTVQERLGFFHFWRAVGRRMHIRDIPSDYEEFERFNREYERDHFRRTEASRRVGTATRELFVGWFPRMLAPLVRGAIHALLDDPLREAFGFPPPSPLLRRWVPGLLRWRARLAGMLPDGKRPHLRTEMRRPNYPHGYEIETLGPEGTRIEEP